MKNLASFIFLLLFFAVVAFSQTNVQKPSIENGWKGIMPLKTDKAFVEKLLGKSRQVDDKGIHSYKTDEALVDVSYSTSPCADDQDKRGRYNVAENTVLGYIVRPFARIKISDFRFKRENYYYSSEDLKRGAYYRNAEDGITIGVHIIEGIEYIAIIGFNPSKQNSNEFKCNK